MGEVNSIPNCVLELSCLNKQVPSYFILSAEEVVEVEHWGAVIFVAGVWYGNFYRLGWKGGGVVCLEWFLGVEPFMICF